VIADELFPEISACFGAARFWPPLMALPSANAIFLTLESQAT
jgi:hypothetical protein